MNTTYDHPVFEDVPMEIVWENPPPRGGSRNGKRKRFVEALKSNPGEWARYPTASKGAGASYVNAKQFPGTEWTKRIQPDGTYRLWARWVGEE